MRQALRRHALVQAVLSLRRERVARRRSRTSPPPPAERKNGRNHEWPHLYNADVISMPDKWEYPWYAAWDLAFHCVPLALVDPSSPRSSSMLLLREWYMHPERAAAGLRMGFRRCQSARARLGCVARLQDRQEASRRRRPRVPRAHLPQAAAQLHLVGEPQGRRGRNIFQGGFLGLDNIGVFDRSAPLPTGGHHRAGRRHRLDGDVLPESAGDRDGAGQAKIPAYEDVASKFWEHFLYIANAMNHRGERRHGHCGTRRTASSTTSCTCRTAAHSA